MYLKFIEVVEYNEDDIWMSIRLKNLMKGSLQVVFGKNDSEKSRCATRQEAREEADLELSQMKYLVTNEDYDCDIYICDIERFKSRCIKSLKAGL